jgi:hypothetical protein
MKLDRLLVLFSLLLSCAATSGIAFKRDPLGTDISKYDLSSPESTLRSINTMATKQDVRAAWQLLRIIALQRDDTGDTKLFLSDEVKIVVLKSLEVSNSGDPKNNGLIVSFVRYTISGVDYHTVQYFRKDQLNRFYMRGGFYVFGTEQTEQDKALAAAIEEFKKTGKI